LAKKERRGRLWERLRIGRLQGRKRIVSKREHSCGRPSICSLRYLGDVKGEGSKGGKPRKTGHGGKTEQIRGGTGEGISSVE